MSLNNTTRGSRLQTGSYGSPLIKGFSLSENQITQLLSDTELYQSYDTDDMATQTETTLAMLDIEEDIVKLKNENTELKEEVKLLMDTTEILQNTTKQIIADYEKIQGDLWEVKTELQLLKGDAWVTKRRGHKMSQPQPPNESSVPDPEPLATLETNSPSPSQQPHNNTQQRNFKAPPEQISALVKMCKMVFNAV